MIPADDIVELRKIWSQRRPASDQIWPAQLINDLRIAQVFQWTIPQSYGGNLLPAEALLANLIELARGDLQTTFILSQFQAACQRICSSHSDSLKTFWLPRLASGDLFTTVGISHLTTSRQHTSPAVLATEVNQRFTLTGDIPWVTGGSHADVIVLGGTLDDGQQILAAVPTDREGLTIGTQMPLLALSGSDTCFISLRNVHVARDEIIAGPVPDVIKSVSAGGTGGLTTSALAIGHALGSLDQLEVETEGRAWLFPVYSALNLQVENLRMRLFQTISATSDASVTENLRKDASDLALRSAQALLTASKGAGFVADHPAGRFCREALFFLVWSCPQPVANQLLKSFSSCGRMQD